MKTKYLVISLSLLVSLFIYLFYRTNKTIVNELAIQLFTYNVFSMVKAQVVANLPLSNVIIYSLPEGLWVLCITLTSRNLYLKLGKHRIDCVYMPIVFAITLEILQLIHITNGRFDFIDIGVSTLFWLIGRYLFPDDSAPQNVFDKFNVRNALCWISYSIVYLSHVIK